MNTAFFPSVHTGQVRGPSTFSLLARNVLNALAKSRARSAARELRRYEAFMTDLGRRQEHSSDFLAQTGDLPFRI